MSKKISAETNAINWFEIAVIDMARAKKFYETILETELTSLEMMGMKMAMFPYSGENDKVGGALVQSEVHTPSKGGTMIYLNANPDLDLVLNRIEKAGGQPNMPKTMIDEKAGYMAFFTDTEGNNIGLHSNK